MHEKKIFNNIGTLQKGSEQLASLVIVHDPNTLIHLYKDPSTPKPIVVSILAPPPL
jgi:uncharacterized protein (DUF2249 family)